MKKFRFYLMVLTAAMMVGCSKEEGDIPTPVQEGVYLGRGYNAAAHYAIDADVKSPVLSLDLLTSKKCIDDPIKPLTTQSYTTYGKDLAEYENKLSQTCKLSGQAWGFKASLSESFTEDAIKTKENSFYNVRYSKEMISYRVFSNVTVDRLKECLSDSFLSDLTKHSAADLVNMYGTHVIVGYTMGGKLEYSVSAMNEGNMTESDFKIIADVGYKGVVGDASAQVDVDKYKKFKNESKNVTEKFLCRGGQSGEIKFEGDAEKRRAIYSEWDKSLNDKSNQVLIQFAEDRGLIPLNEFIDDPTLSQQVADVIKERLQDPIAQNSGYRTLQVFFKEINTERYNDSNGYCKWKFTMTAQPEGQGVSYLFDTYTTDVNIPGGGLQQLITDSGNCSWSGTRAGIDFKNKRYGAHDQTAQQKALAWGEPATRQFKLCRWETNTVSLKVGNLVQHNSGSADDVMGDVTVTLTCQCNADSWKYFKGEQEIEVFDRNSGKSSNIELIGSSVKHPGESVKFLLEYEWK